MDILRLPMMLLGLLRLNPLNQWEREPQFSPDSPQLEEKKVQQIQREIPVDLLLSSILKRVIGIW